MKYCKSEGERVLGVVSYAAFSGIVFICLAPIGTSLEMRNCHVTSTREASQ